LLRGYTSATFAPVMSDPKHAPEIPEVTDEAGDSPEWVPMLGVGLLVLAVAIVLVRLFATQPEAKAATQPASTEAQAADSPSKPTSP
jgi:hypothetical protein